MNTIQARAQDYGKLGGELLNVLDRVPDMVEKASVGSFASRTVAVSSSLSRCLRIHPLVPPALSLLVLPFPLQLDLGDNVVLSLFDAAFPHLRSLTKPIYHQCYDHFTTREAFINDIPFLDRLARFFINNKEARSHLFPRKSHPGAYTKPTVVLGGLLESAVRLYGNRWVGRLLLTLAGRVTEDQLMSALIYAGGLDHTLEGQALTVATCFILDPGAAKALSTALKALGLNSTPLGSLLVEGDTLQGRGVGTVDVDEKAAERCDPEWIRSQVVDADPDELRPHIRSIIQRELRERDVKLPPLEDFWSSRWRWCVNGSETAASDRALGIDTRPLRRTHTRVYRRIAAEMCRDEPLSRWDGTTYVSASPKLEHGKTRMIFACDTRSYFSFSWLLNTVQTAWRNERVLLDPGQGGHLGICRRISNAQRGGGVNLMLDYDDFNSHHSTRTMQLVFEELCDAVGAPAWYKRVLVDSFDHMYLSHHGSWSRVLGTLMSGHRGTTFINSVLNAAYIRAAVGGPYFDKLLSIHTGDDVYVRANTLADCHKILVATKLYGCRLNPSKQSVGFKGAEFLRMGIRGTDAFGYLARGVAGFVNGNWTNLDPLAPDEGVLNAVAGCRTLINRSRSIRVGALCARGLRYRTNLSDRRMVDLCTGRAAIKGSPVFNCDNRPRIYEPQRPKQAAVDVASNWLRYATNDYLQNHVSPVESKAVEMVGVDVSPLLVTSSYSKGLNTSDDATPRLAQLKARTQTIASGIAYAVDLLSQQANPGVLVKYPLIPLIANRLNDDELRELIRDAGGDTLAADPRAEAFGVSSESKNIIGYLSFADAATLSKRTACGNIFTTYQVMV